MQKPAVASSQTWGGRSKLSYRKNTTIQIKFNYKSKLSYEHNKH